MAASNASSACMIKDAPSVGCTAVYHTPCTRRVCVRRVMAAQDASRVGCARVNVLLPHRCSRQQTRLQWRHSHHLRARTRHPQDRRAGALPFGGAAMSTKCCARGHVWRRSQAPLILQSRENDLCYVHFGVPPRNGNAAPACTRSGVAARVCASGGIASACVPSLVQDVGCNGISRAQYSVHSSG